MQDTPDADRWPVKIVAFSNLDRRNLMLLAASFEEWAEGGFGVIPSRCGKFCRRRKRPITVVMFD
jgi:hypothetical protein